LICQNSFETKFSFQKTCSDKCKQKHNKEIKRRWDIDNIEWKREYERTRQLKNLKLRSYRKRISREFKLSSKYGLTQGQWDALREDQNYECAICGLHENDHKNNLSVDHNHTTGEIRGLLCPNCNTGIGMLKDDPILLQKALDYLLNSKTNLFVPNKKEQENN
jgi:hypothetical protein